jgi:hypothetical protein
MAWTRIGSITVGPDDAEVTVGPIEVPAVGGVEVMLRQTQPSQPFKFAYGLLSFESANGRDLGTVKVWATSEFTSYRLGDGLSSQAPSGVLVFEPRSYNLRWIKAGWSWSLEFMADVGNVLPPDRFRTPGLVDGLNRLLGLRSSGSLGRIEF